MTLLFCCILCLECESALHPGFLLCLLMPCLIRKHWFMLNAQQHASDQSASQMFYAHWHDLKFSSKSQLISLVLSVVRVVGSILFSAGDSDGI